tara:strand:+ start:90 stop:233 length:144 start_codon:yes stop_codon:yes gene_type:complete
MDLGSARVISPSYEYLGVENGTGQFGMLPAKNNPTLVRIGGFLGKTE